MFVLFCFFSFSLCDFHSLLCVSLFPFLFDPDLMQSTTLSSLWKCTEFQSHGYLTDTESHSVHWICSLRALFSCVHFDCLSVCVFVCVCYFCLCFWLTGNTFVLSSNGTLYFVGWYWNQGLRIRCNTFAKCIMSCVFGFFFLRKCAAKTFCSKLCCIHFIHFEKKKSILRSPFNLSHSYCAKCPFNLSHIW